VDKNPGSVGGQERSVREDFGFKETMGGKELAQGVVHIYAIYKYYK
jgi:hypothetical protein